MRRLLVAAVLASWLVVPATAQQPAALPVGVVAAERRPVAQTADFVGRVEAVDRVEIRARVTGFIEEVLFKDGQVVKAGDPLFRLEKGPFEAAVRQAEGALLRANGALDNARLQRQRAEDLMRTNAGSVATRDQRVADEKAAEGDVATAEGNLSLAKINLSYTDITAPIDGRIGRTKLTKGNVVGPDSGAVAVIVSEDPMYVLFPVSQREFLHFDREKAAASGKPLQVRITFSDGTTYDKIGTIDFVDVTVAQATDTVTVRATIANEHGKLIDGSLVRVLVQGPEGEEKVLVPQSALIADQQGAYVFAVEDGKAVVKRVKVTGSVGGDAIIGEGLAGGEQVVVEGLQGLRQGVPVLASPVTPPLAGRS